MQIKHGLLTVCLCVIAAACASAPAAAPNEPIIDRVRVTNTGDPNDISYTAAGPSASDSRLEFPARRIWSLVPSAYSLLSIPVNAIDSVHQRVVGSATARGSFGDQPVSSLLDCGSSITGLNADLYTVRFKVTTQVEPVAAAGSRVRIIVDAMGTSSSGANVRCSSTGSLEQQILRLIRQGLAD